MSMTRGLKPPPLSEGWALNVDGRVSHPRLFSLDHLQQIGTANCSSYLLRANKAALPARSHRWQGASGDLIAQLVAPLADADYVRVHALDGYQTVISYAMLTQALIAWRCDDQMLSPARGAPARLILPRRAVNKQFKWLSRLSFINHHELTDAADDIDGRAPLSAWIDLFDTEPLFEGCRTFLTGRILSAVNADQIHAELRVNGGFGRTLSFVDQPDGSLYWQTDWLPAYAGEHRLELHVWDGDMVVTHCTVARVKAR
jgi:DMSO/TMAO reductase YedYZ molybdopterin-dependent catalytic subunit